MPSTTNYGYDARGRLHTLTDDAVSSSAFTFTYDDQDRMTGLIRPNDTVTRYAFDLADRVQAIATHDVADDPASDPPVHELTYAYDATRGLPWKMTDSEDASGAEHVYAHDVRGRLIEADHPSGSALSDESYGYDLAYRRIKTGSDTWSYNSGDQLTNDTVYTYTYDLEGNRQTRTLLASPYTVTTYTWSSLGQLVSISDGTDTWTFGYDALDRRPRIEGPSEGWSVVFDANDLARAQYDDTSGLLALYPAAFGFGDVLAEKPAGGSASFPVRDKLGSPVAWLDGSGAVASSLVRDSYGVRDGGAPGVPVPFGYTGHAEDPTGLVWGRARYLEAASGGWLSEDTVVGEPRFTYVYGMVLTRVDQDGLAAAIDQGLRARLVKLWGHNLALARKAMANLPGAAAGFTRAEIAGQATATRTAITRLVNIEKDKRTASTAASVLLQLARLALLEAMLEGM